jgi:FkbM family methyltransferase
MHNGDDTHYYLLKGAEVVGIEANPALVGRLRERFAVDIAARRLHLVEQAVGDREGTFPFDVYPNDAPQSSFFEQPEDAARHAVWFGPFTKIQVPVVKLSSLFDLYGFPDFIKIDVEHSDTAVLRDLLEANAIPEHLSVEAHGFEVLLLVHHMGFTKFRLVNCGRISEQYRDLLVSTQSGALRYGFPDHSSGPFGEDLPAEWLNIEQVCAQWITRHSLYSLHSFDWYDVHATGLVRTNRSGS